MDAETKCDCQRCGNPIAFPLDLHNTEVECPHCHKSTTLNAQLPVTVVRKSEIQKTGDDGKCSDYSGLGAIGIACAFLLPLIGFFIGIYLITKGQPARGCVCMALSIIAGLGWLALMNS